MASFGLWVMFPSSLRTPPRASRLAGWEFNFLSCIEPGQPWHDGQACRALSSLAPPSPMAGFGLHLCSCLAEDAVACAIDAEWPPGLSGSLISASLVQLALWSPPHGLQVVLLVRQEQDREQRTAAAWNFCLWPVLGPWQQKGQSAYSQSSAGGRTGVAEDSRLGVRLHCC